MLTDILESRDQIASAATAAETTALYGDKNGARSARAARLFQSIDQIDKARELWRAAVERNPTPSWAIRLLELLNPQEDGSEFTDLLARLGEDEANLEPEDHKILTKLRSQMILMSGDDDAVLEQLIQQTQENPEDNHLWNELIALLTRLGKWELLANQTEQRLSVLTDPELMADVAVSLGEVLGEKLGDELGAQTAYDRALECNPNNQKALLAQASLNFDRQKWEKLDLLLERIDFEKAGPHVNLWRASAAEHMGRREEAISLYKTILAANPSDGRAEDGLARLGEKNDLEDKLSNAFRQLRRD